MLTTRVTWRVDDAASDGVRPRRLRVTPVCTGNEKLMTVSDLRETIGEEGQRRLRATSLTERWGRASECSYSVRSTCSARMCGRVHAHPSAPPGTRERGINTSTRTPVTSVHGNRRLTIVVLGFPGVTALDLTVTTSLGGQRQPREESPPPPVSWVENCTLQGGAGGDRQWL